MRLLVTGGAGYIGAVSTRLLIDAGHEVTVVDDLSTGHRRAVDPRARFIQARVHDIARHSLGDLDGIVHLAAKSQVAESVAKPELYWENNVIGSLSLIGFARDRAIPRFVFSSTAAIYGSNDERMIEESAPTMPLNPYGASKLAVDHMLAAEAMAHGLTAFSLRYFNVAGAVADLGELHEPETHLIPRILHAAARGEPVEVFGDDYDTTDGTCIRDYLHVGDLAQAHIAAIEYAPDGRHHVINLGTGSGYSVREVIAAVESVLGRSIEITIRPRRPGDPSRLVAANARARRVLSWRPVSTLSEMIRDANDFRLRAG